MPAISLLQGALAEVAAVEPRPSTNALKVSLGAGGALEIRAGSAWQYGVRRAIIAGIWVAFFQECQQ